MHESSAIDPVRFVETVSPLIEKRNVHALTVVIRSSWTMQQVVKLLDSNHCDAPKVAALALSLIGDKSCLEPLSRKLTHPDRCLNQMAEHAIWSIWFRAGNEQANAHVARGTQHLAKQEIEKAVEQFSLAIAADPTFAEAYNQRAMAYYLSEKFAESLADCRQTVQLMPLHFGAWAGMGHCHAALGQTCKAIAAYRQARKINPHLECLDELIAELENDKHAD